MPRRKRLDPAAFHLPVESVRQGAYADRGLLRAREVLRDAGRAPRVLLQVACTASGHLGGVDEAIAALKLGADDWGALGVHALYEGDRVEAWDSVLTVEGAYDQFAHLEPLVVALLARRTTVATAMRAAVEAARRKPVLCLADWQDHWLTQPGDGYAAAAVGAMLPVGAAASWAGAPRYATVPHGLIAACRGDAAAAAGEVAAGLDPAVRLIAPADYENDCVRTSVDLARALDGQLWGVRLGTADQLVDRSILSQMGAFPPTGVNPQLVWNVRNALDAEGFGEVKIVAAGALTAERIRGFEEDGVPVDAYAVGAALLDGRRAEFSADVVQVDGAPQARAGRALRPNPKLERVK